MQSFPSSQLRGGPPRQIPPPHASFVVHGLPSSQGFVFGVPLWQPPPPHVSALVHPFPSSHGAVLLACMHPVAGLQVSSVQRLLSSQLRGGPPWHTPPPHTSFAVHALPSSHGAVLFV